MISPQHPSVTRPSWDAIWMEVADAVAKRSRCTRAQHGAVIVTKHNRILATGYNGPAAGYPTLTDEGCHAWCARAISGPREVMSYEDCPAIHAEANALMFTERHLREAGTLYVNGAMCVNCAKLTANSGVARVVMRINEDEGHRQPNVGVTHLRVCGLEVDVWG